jgi:hypothetical protein
MNITKEKIVELLDKGMKKTEVAYFFGKKRETFSHYLRKFQLTEPKNLYSKEEIEILKEHYPIKPTNEVVKLLPNRSLCSIKEKSKELNLKKTIDHPMRVPKSDLKILLDENLESFYWIGYILADGNLNKALSSLNLTSSIIDKAQLERYAKYIKTSNIYESISGSGFNNKKYYKISVVTQDKENVEKISKKFNIKPNKTKYPPDTNIYKMFREDQCIALVLGIIDGDGTITFNNRQYQLSIYGSYEWSGFYKFIGDILKDKYRLNYYFVGSRKIRNFKDKNGIIKPRNQDAYLRICSKRLLQELKYFALYNNLPILERKWNKVIA